MGNPGIIAANRIRVETFTGNSKRSATFPVKAIIKNMNSPAPPAADKAMVSKVHARI